MPKRHLRVSRKRCVLPVLCLAGLATPVGAGAGAPPLVFCCRADNDLYRVLVRMGEKHPRFGAPEEAVHAAADGAGVLILADGYPGETTDIAPGVYKTAAEKNLRLYVEFPASLPGMSVGEPRDAALERAVVASDFFQRPLAGRPHLDKLRVMAVNGKRFVPISVPSSHIVLARVAGFDSAVYGLPEETFPLLFEHPKGNVLVSTTKLSHFVTGRYAPSDAIRAVWHGILEWLAPGEKVPDLQWTPTVRPSYGRDEPLPRNAERRAMERGVEWYRKSKLLPPVALNEELARRAQEGSNLPAPSPDEPIGDGSAGVLQCYLSAILPDGSQERNVVRRGDNQCETAMTLALAGEIDGDKKKLAVAGNILDYYLFQSDARKGARADPNHGAYGMIAWGAGDPAWLVANYGDDAARQMLGVFATAAVTGERRWNEAAALCLLANLRTTGPLGFRHDRIDMGPLEERGWRPFFEEPVVRMSPHFEAYLWACFLWAHHHTGDGLFYDRTEKAIRMTMEHYPDGWSWTNGLAQEKARMLLPLAWLVRVQDTAEHREWLRRVGQGLIALQAPCGGIREELGALEKGMFPPPQSNEAYGGNEASLIQENGDPVCDLLYTTNFAFLGLHEAAAATGDPLFVEAEDKLAEFLCRIQVRSEKRPELDGAWFRGFDFKRWEHWASDADAGWGAWCAITGWTQSWITSVLAMRELKASLWDLTRETTISEAHGKHRPVMIPEEAVQGAQDDADADAETGRGDARGTGRVGRAP